MKSERELPNPTPGELDILRVLWAQGPCTVREVNDEIGKSRDVVYTTTLKLLQIMTEKGLVSREEVGKGHVYTARLSEEKTQKGMVDEFLDRAFGGAARNLILHALSTRKTSPADLAEIRRLLDALEAEE